jgi:membrane protein DedA with SNARE-associated domain
LVAAAGVLNIWWINVILIVAAIVGDSVGYAIGARLGPALFTREKFGTSSERGSSTPVTAHEPS